jgi:hypothetical protein
VVSVNDDTVVDYDKVKAVIVEYLYRVETHQAMWATIDLAVASKHPGLGNREQLVNVVDKALGLLDDDGLVRIGTEGVRLTVKQWLLMSERAMQDGKCPLPK